MRFDKEFREVVLSLSLLLIANLILASLNLGLLMKNFSLRNPPPHLEGSVRVVNDSKVVFEPKHFNLTGLQAFLKNDTTDEVYYDGITCRDYSDILINHLHKKDYFDECDVSIILNTGMSHSLVAINTTDGLFFVEPQTDQIFTLRVGDDYCDKVSFACARKDWIVEKIQDCYVN